MQRRRSVLQEKLRYEAIFGLALGLASCNQAHSVRSQVVERSVPSRVANANQAMPDAEIASPDADPTLAFIQTNLLGTLWQSSGTLACQLQDKGEQAGKYYKAVMSFVDSSIYILNSFYFTDAACTVVDNNIVQSEERAFVLEASEIAGEWNMKFRSAGGDLTFTKLKFADSRLNLAKNANVSQDGFTAEKRFSEFPIDSWYDKVGGNENGSEATALELVTNKLLGRVFRFQGNIPACRSDFNRIFYDTSIVFLTPTTVALTWIQYQDSQCATKTGSVATQYYSFTLTPSQKPKEWLLDWGPNYGALRYTLFKFEGDRFYFGKDDPIQDGSSAAKRPTELSVSAWYQSVQTLPLQAPGAPPLN